MSQITATSATRRNVLFLTYLAHCVSHIHLMVLPPIIGFLVHHYGASFTQIGAAVAVAAVVTTIMQPFFGIWADRYGPKVLLQGALFASGVLYASLALTDSFVLFCLLIACTGVSNAVYHPADYAVIQAHTEDGQRGKSFALHTFAGFAGGAITPITISAIATAWSWQAGLIASGAVAIVVALLIGLLPKATPKERALRREAAKPRVKLTGPVLKLTAFFFFVAISTSGFQLFAIEVMGRTHGFSLAQSGKALSGFLIFMAFGVLLGGWLADARSDHEKIASVSYILAGVLMALVTQIDSYYPALAILSVSGLFVGMVMPSRDVMVSKIADPASAGRTFGIVTSGLNLGGILAPPMFGLLVDNGHYLSVIWMSAALMVLTGIIALSQK